MNRYSIYLIATLLGLLVILSWGCPEGSGTLKQNSHPVARLANIPPTNQTTMLEGPILTLSWVGDDPDGYVTAYKYRWSYTITRGNVTDTLQKSWNTILNIRYGSGTAALALMLDTIYQNSETKVVDVYKYLANLNPPLLDLPVETQKGLYRGDTVLIAGVRVFAANPDSIIEQTTGQRVLKRFPVHINPNAGTFVFDSQDSLNFHEFQIIAIDNQGATSDPATVTFVTPRVPAPNTYIEVSPSEEDTFFVLDKPTDSFPGLYFKFNAKDANSRTREFQWVVDRDEYPAGEVPWSQWSERPYAYVNASHFKEKYATKHTFHVRARNEFGSIDTTGFYISPITDDIGQVTGYDTVYADVVFYTMYPEFARPGAQKRVLLLNNSYEYKVEDATPYQPSYAMLNAYYAQLMTEAGMDGKYDLWMSKYNGFPSRATLAKYSTVVFVGDVVSDELKWFKGSIEERNLAVTASKYNTIVDYAYIGGKFFWSGRYIGLGTNIDRGIFTTVIFADVLSDDFLSPKFVGAKGLVGYPTAMLDTTKLDPAWNGVLKGGYFVLPRVFAERIYKYDHKDNFVLIRGGDGARLYEDADIGIRYEGITFSSIYLGFPLYYVRQTEASEILKIALHDLGER